MLAAGIGGEAEQGTQRVWLDGKPVSPPGFTAGGQTFCDTAAQIRAKRKSIVTLYDLVEERVAAIRSRR